MMRNTMTRFALLAGIASCTSLVGCVETDIDENNRVIDEMIAAHDADKAANKAATNLEILKNAAESARARADKLASEKPSNVTPDDMVRGKKIDTTGPLSSPIKAGIKAEQTLNTYQWQQALQIYTAQNNLDYPESHEEFMEKVIQANGIVLEELLEPYEYLYIPEVNNLQKQVKQSAIDEAEAAAKKAEAAYQAALKKE